MSGLPYDPVVQLSTSLARLSVMEGRTLAIATYNAKLDDNFEIAATDPAERDKVEAGMREVMSRIESDMDPFVAGRQMDTDEIIELASLRDWLATLVEASCQSIGHRRIKNPRIWSLHDLRVLTEAARPRAAAPDVGPAPSSTPARKAPATPGAIAIRAPSSGRFWARPSPDKPPFVTVGDTISTGHTLGLLEVIKTFHRVTYTGEGLPPRAPVLPAAGDRSARRAVSPRHQPARLLQARAPASGARPPGRPAEAARDRARVLKAGAAAQRPQNSYIRVSWILHSEGSRLT